MKNEILVVARMKSAIADEIFGFASDEMRSDLLSPRSGISSRSDFIPPQWDFTCHQGRISLQKNPFVLQWVHLGANDYGWVQNKARWVQHRAFVFLLETI